MEINKDYACDKSNYAVMDGKKNEYIVIHYVGGEGTALSNVKYFCSTPNLSASAHYFVGQISEDGAVYQSVADSERAWHCGANAYKHPYCRNANSIGIEMCCHKDSYGNWYFDDVTVDKAICLTRELMAQYDIPVSNVLRHYDVTGKVCPEPYVTDEAKWQAFLKRLTNKQNSEEEDDMAAVVKQIAQNTGKTEDQVIEALSVLVQFSNTTAEDWEKQGVDKLKGMGIINSDHDPREPVGFGTLGLMLERFKKGM